MIDSRSSNVNDNNNRQKNKKKSKKEKRVLMHLRHRDRNRDGGTMALTFPNASQVARSKGSRRNRNIRDPQIPRSSSDRRECWMITKKLGIFSACCY